MTATNGAVTLRYYARAGAAAGVDEETLIAGPRVADVVAAAVDAHPALAEVMPVCSILSAGRTTSGEVALADLPVPVVLEVLPPFAGG